MICAELRKAGVDCDRIADGREFSVAFLQDRVNQSATTLEVLIRVLPELRTINVADTTSRAIGLHAQLTDDHLGVLLDVSQKLRPCSLELYYQVLRYDTLRVPSRSKVYRWAEHEVRCCWYASPRPPKPEPYLRVEDDDFPTEKELSSLRDQFFMVELSAAMYQHARAGIFDRVAAIAADRRYGFGRTAYPGLLYRCDKRRAAPVLMPLLEDPDIGIDALDILGKLKHRDALRCAEQFLDHPCKQVQKIAKKAILRLKDA